MKLAKFLLVVHWLVIPFFLAMLSGKETALVAAARFKKSKCKRKCRFSKRLQKDQCIKKVCLKPKRRNRCWNRKETKCCKRKCRTVRDRRKGKIVKVKFCARVCQKAKKVQKPTESEA